MVQQTSSLAVFAITAAAGGQALPCVGFWILAYIVCTFSMGIWILLLFF